MKNKELLVGLFFFAGLLILGLLSFAIDDEGNIFSGGYNKKYYTLIKDVGQVSRGSIVRMAGSGVQVGRVDNIELQAVGEPGSEQYLLRLDFSLRDEYDLRTDSEVRLAMTTLLQGMHVEITPGTPSAEILKPGSMVAVGKSSDFMSTLASLGDTLEGLGDGGLGRMLLGSDGLDNIGKVFDTLAKDGGLGRWALGDEAAANLAPTMGDLKEAVANIRRGTEGSGTVARLLHDEKMGEEIGSIITDVSAGAKDLRQFANMIAEGEGVIARLAGDAEMGRKLDGIVTDIRAVTHDLAEGRSVLSRLIRDEEMGESLATSVANIAAFTEGLAKGEGTLARLINDPELYVEARRLIIQAREAVEDAREAAPISSFASILFGALQ